MPIENEVKWVMHGEDSRYYGMEKYLDAYTEDGDTEEAGSPGRFTADPEFEQQCEQVLVTLIRTRITTCYPG